MKELKSRKIKTQALAEFGFIDNTFTKDILDGKFKVIINIDKDKVTTAIIDNALNEEYVLAEVDSATGKYIGQVKDAYQSIINEFLNTCTTLEYYKSKQAKEVIAYIEAKYNITIEHLWKKDPENAIWRNKENNKWFGALLVVSEAKIDNKSNDLIEIIDLRYQKDNIQNIIDNKKIFPGYHMNKQSWITIKLDGTVDIKTINKLIDNSYELSLKAK